MRELDLISSQFVEPLHGRRGSSERGRHRIGKNLLHDPVWRTFLTVGKSSNLLGQLAAKPEAELQSAFTLVRHVIPRGPPQVSSVARYQIPARP